jgi:hypothetical protein
MARTLSDTLLAAQQSNVTDSLVTIVLTSGATSYTYYSPRLTDSTDNRVLNVQENEDGQYSHGATIILDNADKTISAIDFQGFKCVISMGATTSGGDEYSPFPPLWVIRQVDNSQDTGDLTVDLILEGTPNRLARDKALDNFLPSASDALTVKTYLTRIITAVSPFTAWAANHVYAKGDYVRKTTSNGYAYKCTVAGTSHGTTEPTWPTTIGTTPITDGTVTWVCVSTDNPFAGCTAYTATFDSEDSLIDSFTPKSKLRIYKGQTRLSVIRWLLENTGCTMRTEDDEEIHIFVPNTAPSTTTEVLRPNAAGDETGNAPDPVVANYLNVDEVVADEDATIAYNSGTVLTNYTRDLYHLPSSAINKGHISQIVVTARCIATGAVDQASLKICCKTHGTVYESDAETVTTSWANYTKTWATNPFTGLSWQWNEITDLQIGEALRSCDNLGLNSTVCTQIFVTITYQPVDYEYSLDVGHPFFNKAYRKSLVMPNKIVVSSQTDDSTQYTGSATSAASFALLPVTHPVTRTVASNNEAAAIATAIIGRLEREAESGSALVPMNVGAELHDFVLVTDSRAGDYRTGNNGWLHRRYSSLKDKWEMSFGFGKSAVGQAIDQNVSDLENQSEYGEVIDRLAVKDAYIENIHADSLTLVTVDDIADGSTFARVKKASLTAAGLVLLDQVSDGTTYKLLLAADVSAGHINLTSSASFAAGYDPSLKRRNFVATPTTPYDVGDLWHDASTVKRCTTARASGSYVAGDWTATTLDALTDGTTYGRVLATDISAGHINITSSTLIEGTAQATVGVYIDATNGITIKGGKLRLQDSNGANTASLYIDTSGRLVISSWTVTVTKDLVPDSTNTYGIGLTGNRYLTGFFATINVSQDVIPDTDGGADIGTSSAYFANGYVKEMNVDYLHFNNQQATVGAAGSASALPAAPYGYMKVKYGANTYVVPYYLES